MLVRLALGTDRDALLRLAREYVDEAAPLLPGMRVDEGRIDEVMEAYLATANPTVFVAETGGRVVGFLVASIQPFLFMYGLSTHNDIMFVSQVNRGSRAAALLVASFDEWSENLGAILSTGGNANKLHTERTASFYEKFGYERVGVSLVKFRSATNVLPLRRE